MKLITRVAILGALAVVLCVGAALLFNGGGPAENATKLRTETLVNTTWDFAPPIERVQFCADLALMGDNQEAAVEQLKAAAKAENLSTFNSVDLDYMIDLFKDKCANG